ncbi:MAG TPA: hypothetical protein PLH94_07050 [Fimbriimonadaceae bacterium]|nr:hypothetical protein [Fimbriimonadaceae bacterium]
MAKLRLGPIIRNLRGKWAGTVVQGGRDGLITREDVTPKNPRTDAQVAVRANFAKAASLFSNFNPSQAGQWNLYATTIERMNRVNGRKNNPTGFNVFTELTAKYLQVNPTGTPPSTPPTSAFGGDDVKFTLTASTGKLTFTADKPNASGVTTELLIQRLASGNRKPASNGYRTNQFFQFQTGSLSRDVALLPGNYAAAIRFVNKNTGQAGPLVPLTKAVISFAVEEGGTKSQKKAA